MPLRFVQQPIALNSLNSIVKTSRNLIGFLKMCSRFESQSQLGIQIASESVEITRKSKTRDADLDSKEKPRIMDHSKCKAKDQNLIENGEVPSKKMKCDNVVIKLTDKTKDEKAILKLASEALNEGKVIALPTDTIYGIAALAQNSKALEKLYKIKGRDPKKPISICVGHTEDVKKWGLVTIPDKVLNSLLPGPVTTVFEQSSQLNKDLNPGTNLIGIRVPDYGFVQKLAKESGSPLALTSANRSGQASTVSVEEFSEIWDDIDIVFDGGPIIKSDSDNAREGSTVVDLSSKGFFKIIRAGSACDQTKKCFLKHNIIER